MLGAESNLVNAGQERCAAGRADTGGGENPRVAHSLGSQAVEVRRVGDAVAEGTDTRTEIFGDEKQEVRVRVGGDRGAGQGEAYSQRREQPRDGHRRA